MNKIFLGDCLEIMPKIESGSIDMILCDLPYGTTKAKWDSEIDLKLLWQQYNRIIKDNGAILLFSQIPFTIKLGNSNIENLRYEWIWEKTQATGHLNVKKMPMKAHENILVFYKSLPTYNPQKTDGHERKVSTAKHKKNTSTNQSELYNPYDKFTDYDSTERYPRTVLKFPSDKQKIALHPTQKPLALCEYFIKTYTNENDIVLDNCCGSGTTLLAAKNLNRNYIGIEKDEKYFNIAKERVNESRGI